MQEVFEKIIEKLEEIRVKKRVIKKNAIQKNFAEFV